MFGGIWKANGYFDKYFLDQILEHSAKLHLFYCNIGWKLTVNQSKRLGSPGKAIQLSKQRNAYICTQNIFIIPCEINLDFC